MRYIYIQLYRALPLRHKIELSGFNSMNLATKNYSFGDQNSGLESHIELHQCIISSEYFRMLNICTINVQIFVKSLFGSERYEIHGKYCGNGGGTHKIQMMLIVR